MKPALLLATTSLLLGACEREPYQLDLSITPADRTVLIIVDQEKRQPIRIRHAVIDLQTPVAERSMPPLVTDYAPSDRLGYAAFTSTLAPEVLRLPVGVMDDAPSDAPHHVLSRLAQSFDRQLGAEVVDDVLTPWHPAPDLDEVLAHARPPRVRDCIRFEIELEFTLPPPANVTFVLPRADGSVLIGTEEGGVHRPSNDRPARLFLLDRARVTHEVTSAAAELQLFRVAALLPDGRLFIASDGDQVFIIDDVRPIGGGLAEFVGLRALPLPPNAGARTVCDGDSAEPDQAWLSRGHFPRAIELEWRGDDDFTAYFLDRAGALIHYDGMARTCLGRLRLLNDGLLGRLARDRDGSIVAISPGDGRILRARGRTASFETVFAPGEGSSAVYTSPSFGMVLGTTQGRVLLSDQAGGWRPRDGQLISPVYDFLEIENQTSGERGLFITGAEGVAGQTWRRDPDLCLLDGSFTSQAGRFIRPLPEGLFLVLGERPNGALDQSIRAFIVRPLFESMD